MFHESAYSVYLVDETDETNSTSNFTESQMYYKDWKTGKMCYRTYLYINIYVCVSEAFVMCVLQVVMCALKEFISTFVCPSQAVCLRSL